MIKFNKYLLLLFIIIGLSGLSAEGRGEVVPEEGQVEVLSLEGQVTVMKASGEVQRLKEGDLISVEDTLKSESGASADLAYDKDWNNVAHLEENSQVKIDSVYPPQLSLTKGGVLAKLKSLPKGSSFQVETPTAVAAVRGTEYRTLVENDEGQIFNYSDSQVYVFGKDSSGQVSETPLILENAQASGPVRLGHPLPSPRAMTADENRHGQKIRARLDQHVADNKARGRVGRLPDVRAIEKIHQEKQHLFGSGRMFSQEGVRGNTQRMKAVLDRQDRFMRAMDSAEEVRRSGRTPRDPEAHSIRDDSRPGAGGPPAGPGEGPAERGPGHGHPPAGPDNFSRENSGHGPMDSPRHSSEGRVQGRPDFQAADRQAGPRHTMGGGFKPEGNGMERHSKPGLHRDGGTGTPGQKHSAPGGGNRPAASRPKQGPKR